MSNFCASCGTATGGGRFCPKCGSPQVLDAHAAAAASQPVSGYPPPAPRKSNVLKIVLITLAVLFALGVFGAVRFYYFAKDRIQEARQEIEHAKTGPAQETQAGCNLLDKDKVAGILGMTVGRSEGNEAGDVPEVCKYYFDRAKPSDSADDAKTKDSQPDIGTIVKKIASAAKDRPLITVQVYRGNAAAALIGIKTVTRLSGKNEPSLPGPWDEAYFGPMDTTFAVRKGENGILLDLTGIEKKRSAGVELAKAMMAGL